MPWGFVTPGKPLRVETMPRRLPSPWTAEQIPGGYVVKDATGQSLAYVLRPPDQTQNSCGSVVCGSTGCGSVIGGSVVCGSTGCGSVIGGSVVCGSTGGSSGGCGEIVLGRVVERKTSSIEIRAIFIPTKKQAAARIAAAAASQRSGRRQVVNSGDLSLIVRLR